MDPITAAIVAVLPALASDVVKSGVKDAYEALKGVIRRKWGDTAPITKAISALEEDPKSAAQAGVLVEKVGEVKASEDGEVLQALKLLVEQMKTHDIGGAGGPEIQVSMSGGTAVVVGSKDVKIGPVTVGVPSKG